MLKKYAVGGLIAATAATALLTSQPASAQAPSWGGGGGGWGGWHRTGAWSRSGNFHAGRNALFTHIRLRIRNRNNNIAIARNAQAQKHRQRQVQDGLRVPTTLRGSNTSGDPGTKPVGAPPDAGAPER